MAHTASKCSIATVIPGEETTIADTRVGRPYFNDLHELPLMRHGEDRLACDLLHHTIGLPTIQGVPVPTGLDTAAGRAKRGEFVRLVEAAGRGSTEGPPKECRGHPSRARCS